MLDVIADRLPDEVSQKRTLLVKAPGDVLPLPEASVDLAVSSFVLQVVENRSAALQEACRVLVPRGGLAYVTWLKREGAFPPGLAVDEALGGPSDTDWNGGALAAGDVPSIEEAERELKAAGFAESHVTIDELQYDWSPDLYLRYVEACRNAGDFAGLDAGGRASLRARLRRALDLLPPDVFHSRAPVVFALARRST
jgi:SAM-dependent methyltransferase